MTSEYVCGKWRRADIPAIKCNYRIIRHTRLIISVSSC